MNRPPVPIPRHAAPRVGRAAAVVLSVVVPVFNEAAVIEDFHRRLAAVLDALAISSEMLYVNDGSSDDSMRLLREFADADARVVLLDFSRNFGKEIAMTAGLDHAGGEAVIVIDSDLQDPPELIPDMLREWQAGVDVVMMRRQSREGESWLKKATASWFYRLIGSIGELPIPADVGDFRLLSRRAVDALRELPERTRFMKGLFAWVGYRQTTLDYARDARFAGETKWNYWRLWNLALEGITSFSSAPLKMASYVGLATAVYALALGRLRVRQGAAVRRPGGRLPVADGDGAVPRRRAADRAGHHRRVPGAHVRRGQGAAAVPAERRVSTSRRSPPVEGAAAAGATARRGRARGGRMKSRHLLLAVLVVVVLVRLASLGLYPLTDTTEARYGEMGRKMLETANWISPQWDVRRAVLGQAAAVVLGQRGVDGGVRRQRVRCALGDARLRAGHGALFWRWPHEPAPRRAAAMAAALVLLSSVLGFLIAGAVATDVFMTFGMTLSMVAFWNALHDAARAPRPTAGGSSSGWRSACSPRARWPW